MNLHKCLLRLKINKITLKTHKNTLMTSREKIDLNTIGGRITFLRRLVGITRPDIEAKYGFKETTLYSYECGRKPITSNGLNKCLTIFRNEGIIVTEEWLKFGQGPDPVINADKTSLIIGKSSSSFLSNKEIDIVQEIEFFKSIYPDLLFHFVNNAEMSPQFNAGDYIAGSYFTNEEYLKEMDSFHNIDCIIVLSSGEQIFRKIIVDSNKNYSFNCNNPSVAKDPFLYNLTIKKIAPVIFHRIKTKEEFIKLKQKNTVST
ncbi:MAG: hypothetical protein J0H68_09450 [Sphingobacteriia bacterium]|nr:hypothetical protein [Sphingobacteriia bacterium]